MLQTAVVVGSCSCESCAGQGMLLPLGKPRSLPESEFKRDLNATFSPARFLQCVPPLSRSDTLGTRAAFDNTAVNLPAAGLVALN